ncbi:MAG TPA: glycoside hydrolase family 3 N-terminal domain-containing protein [Blastocatellia bacterium]|nr:glycoside hydrolase family 3 N-terminal domain-containing protein [Blastocatellia bacterium]
MNKNRLHSNLIERGRRSTLPALLIAALVLCAQSEASLQGDRPGYRDARLPVERRVADLVGRMTLEEKVAQLSCLWVKKPQQIDEPGNFSFPDRGDFSPEKASVVLKNGIGHIARQRERKDARASAVFANAVQKFLAEKTRLGIPAIFHDEALHGHMAKGGTHFPQPLALAASWDTELVRRVFTAAALEVRARGGHQVLGPNLDLAREPRWGRTEETYGEDPYLASRMGVACIKALQGPGPGVGREHVIATGKHYAAHGQPEGGTNIAPANYSERIIREVFLPPFEAAVKEAGLMSVMPSYNEIDGVPSHASRFLLEKVLRREWGFTGLIVSDYDGIAQLYTRHRVAADKAEAAKLALEAGVDVELPDPDCYQTIPQLIAEGKLSESALDRAVGRILKAKFLLGLFENPYVDPERAAKLANSQPHRELAAEAARRSIVLLKNEKNVLPLDPGRLRSIAVIGPNADRAHLGGYSDDPMRGVSLLDGIRSKVGSRVKVNYAKGCNITVEGGDWWADKARLPDPSGEAKLIAEAVQAARASDAVVLALGGNEDTNKEAWAENHLGDRDSLELVGQQNELVRAVLEAGKPTIVFLINSGPLSINYIAENAPAILEGFYLGQETGVAAADVLFGDYNPSGKLPVSFPRSVGQLPIYYNQKPTAKRGYLFTSKEPLFAFGHGLSYTTFEYSTPAVRPEKIGPAGQASVSVTVTNTGRVAGDEIVQLYIRDQVSSVTRPVKELKGFERITLAPGQSRTVTFTITPDKLSFLDLNMNRVVEPGLFDIMVGPDSTRHKLARLEVR